MEKKITSIYDFLEQTKDMTPAEAGSQFYWLTQEEITEILSQKTPNPKAEGETKKPKGKEKNEKFTSVLPWAVSKQEADATKYFTDNNEAKHLQVITQIQELRNKKMITYKDTGNGTYEVHFNLPWNKMKRYMPPDTHLDDATATPTYRDGNSITSWRTTKGKLRNETSQKYLEEKEKKEHKSLLSKEEFLVLWKALCPTGSSEEEQILAIMIATGFYGRMRLSDKTTSYQLAFKCSRNSFNRTFYKMLHAYNVCSIIYTSTL